MNKQFVGIKQIAERWAVSEFTVRRALRRGLKYHKLGGLVRVEVGDLERFEAARKVHAGREAGR